MIFNTELLEQIISRIKLCQDELSALIDLLDVCVADSYSQSELWEQNSDNS